MIDLAQLRVFVRIVDVGGISGAARSLGMPKSSVSRALVRLEEALGTGLVERSTRRLRPTDAGRLLRRHAGRILEDVAEAENAIGGLVGQPSGALRVSVGFTFAVGPLAAMLPGFLARYPEVRLVLSVENRPVDFAIEEIDVSIRIGPLRDSELIARKLATVPIWPCASPAYVAASGMPRSAEDLLAHRLIAHSEGGTWRIRTPTGAAFEAQTSPRAVVPEPAVLKTLLIGGAGIGWLPDFHARDALADGTLVRILPDHPADAVDVHALYPSHRSLSLKVRVFIDALAAHLARMR